MQYDLKKISDERAILVQVVTRSGEYRFADESLLELERLSDTAGVKVVGSIVQRRSRPTPSFFVGEGKLTDIKMACRRTGANLVIVDNELSPVQVNNLDIAIGVKVIDRTELILQIFARRARSAEAQIQVELAQLQYLVSRIPVSERQQRFKGGIGMKGPGESPFQLRSEPMRRRIRDLKDKLETISQRRKRTRSRRQWPLVSLAGYTNAGKSTLLNAFTPAGAYVDDRLFATLDTKTRLVRLGGGSDVLMTDTVGFIRNLPHGLVASFRSTLEEIAESDLLLVVAEASHPAVEDQVKIVTQTLGEIGAEKVPAILLLNKYDRCDAGQSASLRQKFPDGLPVSALTGQGLPEVKDAIALKLRAALA
ncbi:MAG: GTPase HflX [bacterium]